MKRIVVFTLCVALLFGAKSLPWFYGATISTLSNVAERATELLLPTTINPENITVTKEIAEKINNATSDTIIDVSGLDDGELVEDVVMSSKLYLNTADGFFYIVIRRLNFLSSVPLIGDRMTTKICVPAVARGVSLSYAVVGVIGSQLDTLLVPIVKVFTLQETNINTIDWIGENW